MIKALKTTNSDLIGAWASGLCLIHCVATPFIFIAQSCSATCCDSSPIWWQSIDFIFLVVSFFAVYWSVKHSAKSWIKNGLWISWVLLTLCILIEKFLVSLHFNGMVYIPAAALIGLHIYNSLIRLPRNNEDCCDIN